MTVHALIRVGALASVIAMGSCGSLDNPELVRPGAMVNAIEVRNAADQPITDLRIGICGETFGFGPDYGYDRLEGDHIPVGGARRFPASPGCYHVTAMIGGSFFSSGAERFDVVIVPEQPGAVGRWDIQ